MMYYREEEQVCDFLKQALFSRKEYKQIKIFFVLNFTKSYCQLRCQFLNLETSYLSTLKLAL